VGRERSSDKDQTVRRKIDVAAAFAATEDRVPVLLMPRAEVPWADLGDLATKLLLCVDGTTSAKAIATATGSIATPQECARELAALARRGILQLEPDAGAAAGDEAEDELHLEVDVDLSRL
jgi:hypothetical protein